MLCFLPHRRLPRHKFPAACFYLKFKEDPVIDEYLKPNVKRGAIYGAIIGIVIGIISLIPLLNCIALPLTCVISLLVPFAIGWFVAQWGTSPTMALVKTPLAIQSTSPYATPAVDGAVAAALASLVAGIITWIAGLIFSGIFATVAAANAGEAGQAAAGLAFGGAFGIIGVIFGAVIAAIAGAIGGAGYVMVNQRNAATPTTPPTTPPPAV